MRTISPRYITSVLAGTLCFGAAAGATAPDSTVAPPATAGKAAPAETNGITTLGQSQLSVKPDIAYLTLEVQTESANAERASQENRALVGRIVAAVKKAGVADRDVLRGDAPEASVFGGGGFSSSGGGFGGGSLGGGGAKTDEPPFALGTVLIVVRNLSNLDAIVASASVGVARGRARVIYGVSDPKAARNAVLRAAVEDALEKAQVIASAAKAGSVRLAGITEGAAHPPVPTGETLKFGQATLTPAASSGGFGLESAASKPVPLTAMATVSARFSVQPAPPASVNLGR